MQVIGAVDEKALVKVIEWFANDEWCGAHDSVEVL